MTELRLEVLGGTGTVCRHGDVVAWFRSGTDADLASALVTACEKATEAGAMADDVARAVRAIVDESSGSAAGFALVSLRESSASLVVQGLVVASDEQVERFRGSRDTLSAVDLTFTSTLSIRGSEDQDVLQRAGCLPFDLLDGVVPGGGVTLHARQVAQGLPPSREASPEDPADLVLFDLVTPPAAVSRPLPLAAEVAEHLASPSGGDQGALAPETPEASEAVLDAADDEMANQSPANASDASGPDDASDPSRREPEPVPVDKQVVGLRCARGHFNHPETLYCQACGLAMVQMSAVLVEGTRPSLGVLILDDGSTYGLDSDYVVGRSPESTEDVQSGAALPLVIDDGTGQISRAHVRITLEGWEALLSDLGSRNGTQIINPGDAAWSFLVPHQPVVLKAGGRIAVGGRRIEFQTLQRR